MRLLSIAADSVRGTLWSSVSGAHDGDIAPLVVVLVLVLVHKVHAAATLHKPLLEACRVDQGTSLDISKYILASTPLSPRSTNHLVCSWQYRSVTTCVASARTSSRRLCSSAVKSAA